MNRNDFQIRLRTDLRQTNADSTLKSAAVRPAKSYRSMPYGLILLVVMTCLIITLESCARAQITRNPNHGFSITRIVRIVQNQQNPQAQPDSRQPQTENRSIPENPVEVRQDQPETPQRTAAAGSSLTTILEDLKSLPGQMFRFLFGFPPI